MINHCKTNLNELKGLLIQLEEDQFTQSLVLLSGATLGQHVRHILEFYKCVKDGVDIDVVNYDKRIRDIILETDISFAILEIDRIGQWMDGLKFNSMVTLKGNFSPGEDTQSSIASSLFREIAYCYEHSIHHQALIKIGLKELEIEHLIDGNFGVAPATIRHKNTCAQ